MTTWYDCTGFQRDCLHAIAAHERTDETPYGLALKSWLDDRYGEPINHSRLYKNLRELEQMELVNREPTNGRTTNYTLTEDGRRALATHARLLASSYDPSWLTTRRKPERVAKP